MRHFPSSFKAEAFSRQKDSHRSFSSGLSSMSTYQDRCNSEIILKFTSVEVKVNSCRIVQGRRILLSITLCLFSIIHLFFASSSRKDLTRFFYLRQGIWHSCFLWCHGESALLWFIKSIVPWFPLGSHFNIPSENPYIVTSLQFTRFFMQTNVRKTRALSIIVNQARNKALKKAGPADSIDTSVKSFMSNGSVWRM